MQVIKDADSFSAHTLGQYNILDSTCWTIHTLDDLTHDSVAISVWQHELYHFYQHMCTVAGVYRNHLLEQALTAVSDAVTKLAPQKQDALQVPLISYFDKEVTDSPRKTIRRYTVLIRRILSLLSGMCGCANLPTRVLTNQDTLALRYAQGKEPILIDMPGPCALEALAFQLLRFIIKYRHLNTLTYRDPNIMDHYHKLKLCLLNFKFSLFCKNWRV